MREYTLFPKIQIKLFALFHELFVTTFVNKNKTINLHTWLKHFNLLTLKFLQATLMACQILTILKNMLCVVCMYVSVSSICPGGRQAELQSVGDAFSPQT